MRFEAVNGYYGFVGKPNARAKMEKALKAISKYIGDYCLGLLDEDEDTILEINYGYDTNVYTQQDMKDIWSSIKRSL